VSVLRWEDPPPLRGADQSQSRWAPVAAELREHPGKWAVIAEYAHPNQASSIAQRIKKGTLSGFAPAGSFDAKSRKVRPKGSEDGEDGEEVEDSEVGEQPAPKVAVHACYIGGGEAR
jgi:hypothetical protein